MEKSANKNIVILVFLLLLLPSAAFGQKRHGDIDIALLGDSNTWIAGDDCSQPKGWPYWFDKKFQPRSLANYSRSGATWTNTANTVRNLKAYSEILDDNNVVCNQIARLIADVDNGSTASPQVIIIGAGTNDAWFRKRRPGVFSETPAQAFADTDTLITGRKPSEVLSLASSVRYGCELLMQRFPDAQIVLLTPTQATVCGYEPIRQAADIIEECGRRLSISTIPLEGGSGTYRAIEKVKKTHTSDGAHTNPDGARRHGYFIANQLESILLF